MRFKTLILLAILVALFIPLSGFSSTWNYEGNLTNQFYYFQGKKIPLQKTDITAVLVEDGYDPQIILSYVTGEPHPNLKKINKNNKSYSTRWLKEQRILLVAAREPNDEYDLLMLRRSFESHNGVVVTAPVFMVGKEKLVVFDEIILKFKKGAELTNLRRIRDASNNAVVSFVARKGPQPQSWVHKIIGYPKFNPTYQVSRMTVIEIANLYYESGLVEYSHPNFIRIQ